MPIADICVYAFLIVGAIVSNTKGKLTLPGSITGALVGLLIYKGAGFAGITMLALFFVAGSWATSWQVKAKAAIGAEEKHKGRRTAGQVVANGGVAALLGALAWCFPAYSALLQVMIAGSFASATADTLSSELGMVYGRNFYNILSLKKDQRGLDGVISLEGTLIGLAGAVSIAIVYALFWGWGVTFLWIIMAGVIGNMVDSVLGASLERKGWIRNNLVNFLNTAVGGWGLLVINIIITYTKTRVIARGNDKAIARVITDNIRDCHAIARNDK